MQFYEDGAELVKSVAGYLEEGLRSGSGVLVIGRPEHRQALGRELAERRLDLAALRDAGRFQVLDASETLARFMVGGMPDEKLFRASVGALVSAACHRAGGLRAYGEMVALLAEEDNAAAALKLEEMWNSLGREHAYSLYCAYPIRVFQGARHAAVFGRICQEHGLVHGFSEQGADPAGQSRAWALLRQKAESLEAESEARRRATARLAAIVESSFDAIIGKDLDGVITSWNRAAETLFGYTEAEAVGRSIRMLIPPDRDFEEDAFLERLKKGEKVPPFETVRRRKDGALLEVSLTVSPVRDENGAVIGASKVARDISELKRYQAALREKDQQLQQVQKMESLGRLAGGIAHEFNNLLTAINGYSDLALSEAPGDGPFRDYLAEINSAGHKAAFRVAQLLAYSRKQILNPKRLDLNRLVRELEADWRRILGDRIEWEFLPDATLELVNTDPVQMESILRHLVQNARDAMPGGGRIMVSTTNVLLEKGSLPPESPAISGPCVMLEIKDTGAGMTEYVKAHVFEPFFTTKDVSQGAGLGLASVFGFLQQSGGSIAVESVPGQGTAFRIYLPAVPHVPGANAPAPSPPAPASEQGVILLVEDNETVRRFLRRILEGRGYTVLEAGDGLAARELAMGTRLDLLLTDVVMPRLGGPELYEALKAGQPGLRTLYISGYVENDRTAALKSEGSDFLQKPFGQAELLRKVRALVRPA